MPQRMRSYIDLLRDSLYMRFHLHFKYTDTVTPLEFLLMLAL